MDNSEIVQRYENLFQERRSNFDQDADLIERYIAPIRAGKFYQEQSSEAEIQFRRPEVFDGTASAAASILSAAIQGAVTPADTKWFGVLFRLDELNKDKEAKEWLQDAGETTYLAIADSTFELSEQEGIQDLVDFGNTAVFEEAILDNGMFAGLAFDTVPIRGIYFEEKYDHTILRFYRRLQWTPLQIQSKFPDDQIPVSIKAKLESPSAANVKLDIIFCIYPREDFIDSFPVAPDKRPFGSKYVYQETGELVGEEDGYYEMPIFLTRWAKTSGSKWGHGPGHLALPTVLTLNQMVRMELAYIEKVIDPVTLVSERNAYGDIDLSAGGINVLADIDGMRDYASSARYGEAKATQGEMREMIERIYKVDQLQMKESPQMTATEATFRKAEILKQFAPTRGRFQREYLNQVVQRSFNILNRYGQFKPPPQSVIDAMNANPGTEMLDIQYFGPMARAAKQEDVGVIQAFVGYLAQMAEFFPAALDKLDIDEMVDEIADLTGVPATIINSDQEIKQVRDQRAAQQKQMQQAQMAQETGKGEQEMAAGAQALEAVQ